MIVRLFRSQQPLGYAVLGITAVVIWVLGYFKSFHVVEAASLPLYGLIVSAAATVGTWPYFLASLLLTGAQALHLNAIVNRHEVLYKNSYFPGFLYLLLAGSIPAMVSFHPVLIVNTLLIIVLDKMFSLFKNDAPLPLVFDSGVLVSLAILVYPPSVFFIILFAAGLAILRPFSWRDWTVAFMGLLTPLFFYTLYFFLADRLDDILAPFHAAPFSWSFDFRNALPPGYAPVAAFLVLLLGLSLWKLRSDYYKNVARTRNFQLVVLVYAAVGLALVLFTPRELYFRYHLLSVPLAVLMSYYFLEAQKLWLADSLVYLFAAGIVANFVLA